VNAPRIQRKRAAGYPPFEARVHSRLRLPVGYTVRVSFDADFRLDTPVPFDARLQPDVRIRAPRIVALAASGASARTRVRAPRRRARRAGRRVTRAVRGAPAPAPPPPPSPPPRPSGDEPPKALGVRTAVGMGAIPVVLVSDATALPAVGLSPRQFKTFVREHAVPHAKVGRRTVARLDRILEAIDRLSGVAEPRRPASWDEAAIVEMAARPTARRSAP
jgi:hypothetical protein